MEVLLQLAVKSGFSCKLRAEHASQTSRVMVFWALNVGAPNRNYILALISRR